MQWKKTLIVVSHDRNFLTSVHSHILYLQELKLFPCRGNYEAFEEMFKQKMKESIKRLICKRSR